MKKLISILLLSCMLISGCGSKTNTIDLTEGTENKVDIVETQEDEVHDILPPDKDVDIVLSMYAVDDTTIDEYIAGLQEENPNVIYSVYDENHYIQTIKESERQKMIEELKSEEYIETTFKEIFSDEQYCGAFVSMEYDDLFQNITFYADKNAYDSAGIAVVFGPIFVGGLFGDIVQAYNLIPIEERTVTILILDNETGEVIYDSSVETS